MVVRFADTIVELYVDGVLIDEEWPHGALYRFQSPFLIGAGYTLLHDGHVRVDIIYQRLSFRAQAWINLLGVIFCLIPGCLMVVITSWKFTHTAWTIMEGSPDPGGIPFRFLIKGCITVGFVLVLLQGFSMGLHSLLQILGHEKAKEH